MPRIMKATAVSSFLLFAAFAAANLRLQADWTLSMAITFATVAYHFIMRLLVGHIYDRVMNNHADYTNKWFRIRPWEPRLYERLRVRKWKGRMPSYCPELFSPELHSWDEIAQAMCQSELVHETIAVLSFLPIGASAFLGSAGVFVVTSLCAALIDLSFVVIQRFNRPLVVRLAQRERMRRQMKST